MRIRMWENRSLLRRMVQRDIKSRYHGSMFGIVWAMATPIMLLCAYWFVLGGVLGARWDGVTPDELPIMLFTGLMIHLFFSEILGRAPRLIVDNSTYVKKVVFPLDILTPMTVVTAIFHLSVAVAVLVAGKLIMTGNFSAAWIFLPITLGAVVPAALGLSWFISSIGVFLRDTEQVVPLVLTVLMFVSPIFYPVSSVPQRYQVFLYLNPLTVPIEQSRNITLAGSAPDWKELGLYMLLSSVVMVLGYAFFRRTQRGFADVI